MNTIKRLRDRQADLKLIWENAVKTAPSRQHMVVRTTDEDTGEPVLLEQSVLRRGFKVTYNPRMEVYELLAIYGGPFYKYASDKEIDFFLSVGFVRACDMLQIKRHKRKIDKYSAKIDKANSERNDSVITHWRNRRLELVNDKSLIEENLTRWPATKLK